MHLRGIASRAILLLTLAFAPTPAQMPLSADCMYPADGQAVTLTVQSCKAIDGRTNKEVLESAGKSYQPSEIQKMYTGALITDPYGTRWMYPSGEANPCRKFAKSSQVKMRASHTCCDSGSWGKCVFGGNWLVDVDAKPFNSSQ